MKQYRFKQEVSQKIVDGILQGYKNYLAERNQKFDEMKISSAYAWVKGNHIDDQIAVKCHSVGVDYKKAKAGYTWGYLQFSSTESRTMFIAKNSRYFDKENFPGGKGIRGKKKAAQDDNYLKKLSQINQEVKFPKVPTLFDDEPTQKYMTLLDDITMKSLEVSDITVLQKQFDRFYIVTYEIDEAHMISSIKSYLPNPEDNKAYEVEDLSDLIESSSVDLSDIDTTAVENDHLESDEYLPNAVDYEIEFDDDIESNNEEEGQS